MYAASCRRGYLCRRAACLWPQVCPQLKLDFNQQAQMLASVRRAPGVRQVHIQSGMRYELLLLPQAREYFRLLCRHFVSGQLKIAPEHVADAVCDLMHKPRKNVLQRFSREYAALNKEIGKKQYLAQYFITAHPGCGPKEAEELAAFTRTMGYTPRQIQDFIPLPMTRSSCMYYTGLDPETGKPLYVARSRRERLQQRCLVQGAKLLD